MTLAREALHGIWGAMRIIRHDPGAFEEFNISVDGFWRSFSAFVPTAVLAWPVFLSSHKFALQSAQADGKPLPDFSLVRDYLSLCLAFVIWPVAAAALAHVLGVARNYSRYLIAYNWMSVPATLLSLVPPALYLGGIIDWQPTVGFSFAVFVGVAYLSWYVALRGFQTAPLIAFAFLVADYVLNFALDAIIR